MFSLQPEGPIVPLLVGAPSSALLVGGSGAAQGGANCLWSTGQGPGSDSPSSCMHCHRFRPEGMGRFLASPGPQAWRRCPGCPPPHSTHGAWVCLGALPPGGEPVCLLKHAPLPPPPSDMARGSSPLNAPVAAFFASLPGWIQAAALAQSPARALGPVLPCPGGEHSLSLALSRVGLASA